MRALKILLFATLVVISSSCSDDEVLPEGEINAQKLNEVIRGRTVQAFYIYTGESSLRVFRQPD